MKKDGVFWTFSGSSKNFSFYSRTLEYIDLFWMRVTQKEPIFPQECIVTFPTLLFSKNKCSFCPHHSKSQRSLNILNVTWVSPFFISTIFNTVLWKSPIFIQFSYATDSKYHIELSKGAFEENNKRPLSSFRPKALCSLKMVLQDPCTHIKEPQGDRCNFLNS